MEPLFAKDRINEIKELLVKRKESIAVAESVTAGLLQFALASADEALKFFQGGVTLYNIGQKTRHLHIDPIYALECDCVSEGVAGKLALNVCDMFCSDWGVGITGYATAVPQSGYEVFCYYAIAYEDKVVLTDKIEGDDGDAQKAQHYYVEEVVKALLKKLKEI